MERSNAVRVDLVKEDLVIHFWDGRTALLGLQDIYDLAVERQAFVEAFLDEEDTTSD